MGAAMGMLISGLLYFIDYLFQSNEFDYFVGLVYTLPVFFRHVVICMLSLIYIVFELIFFKKSVFLESIANAWKELE